MPEPMCVCSSGHEVENNVLFCCRQALHHMQMNAYTNTWGEFICIQASGLWNFFEETPVGAAVGQSLGRQG